MMSLLNSTIPYNGICPLSISAMAALDINSQKENMVFSLDLGAGIFDTTLQKRDHFNLKDKCSLIYPLEKLVDLSTNMALELGSVPLGVFETYYNSKCIKGDIFSCGKGVSLNFLQNCINSGAMIKGEGSNILANQAKVVLSETFDKSLNLHFIYAISQKCIAKRWSECGLHIAGNYAFDYLKNGNYTLDYFKKVFY